MSTRNGIITGLSVLAFVALAFVAYSVKSWAQVSAINTGSNDCYALAKANPTDKLAMDRCLKAKGLLVEDSPRPGIGAQSPATYAPVTADPYDTCRKSSKVAKYKPKTSSWAAELSACMNDMGVTAVIQMKRNPSTGEIDFDVSH